MRGKWLAAGCMALAGVLAWSGSSRAGDTIRLNRVDNAPTTNLVDDGQGTDTIRTWYRGFGGYGGYRGFGYGGYRGFGYGGYRGFGFGGYRGFGFGGYPGFGYGGLGLGYGGFGRGFGYGLGYGGFGRIGFGGGFGGYGLGYGGFYPGFGIGYGGLFGPCAGTTASVYSLSIPVASLGTPLQGTPLPGSPLPGAVLPNNTEFAPVQPPAANGTFPYDGGPQNPVLTPTETSRPSVPRPQRDVPLEGRSVSLPKTAPKWTYPAYGETARRSTPAADRTYLTRSEPKKTSSH